MRTLADYFGLMAYLWLMHGSVPDDAPVMLEEYREVRAPGRRRPRPRVVKGSSTGTARKRAATSEANEAAA